MALPAIPAGAIYVSGIISGALVRFGTKKAAQNFISKYGGKIVSSAKSIKNKKVVSSTAALVKKYISSFKKQPPKNVRGGSLRKKKDDKNKVNKEDMIALTTKRQIKPPPPKPKIKPKKEIKTPPPKPKQSNIKPPAPKPRGININMPKRITGNRPMKNITPSRTGGGGGGRTGGGGRIKPAEFANFKKTILGILNMPKVEIPKKKEVKTPPPKPPLFDNKSKAEVPKSKPKMAAVPKSKPKKDVPIAVKKRTLKKKPSPIQSRKTSKAPLNKPDLSKLTGKFGVEGFSRTGSTMTDFLIGFTDGKGGKGRNYDKFMAKDKDGKYKVKSETLKSMGNKLKKKLKRGVRK